MRQWIYLELLLFGFAFSISSTKYLSQKIIDDHAVVKRSADNPEEEETPLSSHVLPNSYKLVLYPSFDEGIFRGKVEINVSCHEPTDTIILHAHRDLEVATADSTIQSGGAFGGQNEKSVFRKMGDSHHYSRTVRYEQHSIAIFQQYRLLDEDQFVIVLASKMTKGVFYHINLEFLGNISTEVLHGFYRRNYTDSESSEKRWYASVNLNKKNARKVFPCFDQPNFKANVKLSVAVSRSLTVISSMPHEMTENIEGRWEEKLEHFEISPPLVLPSLGFYIFNSSHLQPVATGVSGNVTIYGIGPAKSASQFQSKMKQVVKCLNTLQQYFGFDYPLPQLNLVAFPKEYSRCKEKDFWGLIGFSETNLQDDIFETDIFYLLPKQWIGHMVTPDSQSVLINEGLQIYLTVSVLIEYALEDENTGDLTWLMIFVSELFDMVHGYSSHWYKKVSNGWMWRMLNYTLSEQTMKFGIHNFLHLRKYQIYTEEDLYSALNNQAWLDGVLPLTQSVRDIAKSWTGEVSFPIIIVTRNYEDYSAIIEQHPFIPPKLQNVTSEMMQHLFWVPIRCVSEYSWFGASNQFLTWLSKEEMSISKLPPADEYIIVDPEQIGLFPVTYDKTNWHLLSRYLISSSGESNFRKPLPDSTRSKLMFDATFAALTGELDFGTALDMTLFMRHETNPNQWIILKEIISEIRHLLYDTPMFDNFLVYCRYLYIPAYEYFKDKEIKGKWYEEVSEDMKRMAADVGYEPALEDYKIRFREVIRTNASIDFVGSCAVLRWSEEDWESTLKHSLNLVPINESYHDNPFSQLVWCNRKPKNLIRILHLVFTDDKYSFSSDDVKCILHAINDYDTLLKFVSKHWNEVKSRYGNNEDIWNYLFQEGTQNVKTIEGLQLVLQLYEDRQDELQSAKSIVEESIKTIQKKTNKEFVYVTDINKWLDLHLPTFTSV